MPDARGSFASIGFFGKLDIEAGVPVTVQVLQWARGVIEVARHVTGWKLFESAIKCEQTTRGNWSQ
jgi:hypothetical protein